MADRRDTLLIPFERGLVDPPAEGNRFVFLKAEPLPGNAFSVALACEQGFRGSFLELEQAGYAVQPVLKEEIKNNGGAMMLLGRSRRQNESDLGRVWHMVRHGAPILVAGNKTDGIAAMRKWAGNRAEIGGSLSKNHAVVFWFLRTGDENPFPQPDAETGPAAPGMFSADGADTASVMLARHFDKRIAGRVADFGAGWGYLGKELLERCPGIEMLESFEADWLSLEASRQNLDSSRNGSELAFHWCDLTREPVERRFDWVVMNPPFHAGRAAQPSIGQAFISAASKALKPGGHLLLVANRNLPYERTLERGFTKAEKLEEANGFKILRARR